MSECLWSQISKLQATLWANLYDVVNLSQRTAFYFLQGTVKAIFRGQARQWIFLFYFQSSAYYSMFLMASCFSSPLEFKINSFPLLKTVQTVHPCGWQGAGLIGVCLHLGCYEVACASSQGLSSDWTKRWFFSLGQEIITKLHLVGACDQNHTLEASNFAWKNHSS